jgi:predicted secreted protein
MKKLLLVVALVASSLTPAHAEPIQTIAVIDSGVNTALFTNIVTEVCILEYSYCPNGKSFMEGKGASHTPVTTNATLNHGTEMISIINKVNPSVGIIPIRIVGITDKGNPYIYSNNAVKSGLDWVVANYAKYNITAVSISQGKTFADCKVPDGTAQVVATLKANNVAVIGASGNDGNRSAMDSIACLPDVISVGATDNPDKGTKGIAYDAKAKPYIARYSNGNAKTSFYLNARMYVLQSNGTQKFTVGTSNSTASLAGLWTLNRKSSVAETQATLNAMATVASNEWLTGKYIQLP